MPNVNPWDYAEKSGKEHAHQTALFMWANMAAMFGLAAADDKDSYSKPGHALKVYGWAGPANKGFNGGPDALPQLKWLHAIHNQGHGDAVRGAKAKAEGVKAGVFDLFLPVPVIYFDEPEVSYFGLYIELKVGNNKPSEKQLEFKSDMEAAGYRCEVAWGWLEARKIILDYLGICG